MATWERLSGSNPVMRPMGASSVNWKHAPRMPRGSYGKDARLSSVEKMGSNPIRGTHGEPVRFRRPPRQEVTFELSKGSRCTTRVQGLREDGTLAVLCQSGGMVDTPDSKPGERKLVWVRLPPLVLWALSCGEGNVRSVMQSRATGIASSSGCNLGWVRAFNRPITISAIRYGMA